jgi:hypothetical protein
MGSAAIAKEKPKKEPKGGAAANNEQIMATYDVDKNGNLDVSESGKLASNYEKNPQDPIIKPFDTDSDGKMSDSEIMKILYPNGAPEGKKKGKGKGKAKEKQNKK